MSPRPVRRRGRRNKEGFRSKLARGFGKLFRKGDWGYEYNTYEVPYKVEQEYEYDETVDVTDKVRYVDFSRMVRDFVASVLVRLSEEARKLAWIKDFEERLRKAIGC